MATSHAHGTRFAVRQASQQQLGDLTPQPSTLSETSSTSGLSSSQLKTGINKMTSAQKNENVVKQISKKKLISNKCKSKRVISTSLNSSITSSSIDSSILCSTPTTNDSLLSKINTTTSIPGTNTTTTTTTSTSISGTNTTTSSTSISGTNTTTTTSSTSIRNNPVIQALSLTDDVGLKSSSRDSTKTSSINVNQLVVDFRAKLKAKDDMISDLKKKIEERNQKIRDIEQSTMTIPSEPLVIDWIDHVYELIHKDDLQRDVDYKHYAHALNIDEETLKNCVNEKDRIKTARMIVRNFTDYEVLISMDNGWQSIDKDKINIVLEFVRKLFGPSITTTDNAVRVSLATMIRTARWKTRDQNVDIDANNNVS